jgi:tryptophanyl-tRNA synthetase
MLIDWLAAGLDPDKCVMFIQSDVKEHAELHLLFSMFVPLAWLERVPTYKERLREQSTRELATYGFLGYPVLQAADILIYKGEAVPVGEDQLPHLELTREIARRFNFLYGDTFPEPQALLTSFPTLPGTDGRKMSKSYDNSILLSAPPEEVRRRVSGMVTDPARIRRKDPGHPDVCTAFTFHQVFNPGEVEKVRESCASAGIGCVECKRILGDVMAGVMAPHFERRVRYVENPSLLDDVIHDGARKAREEAQRVIAQARDAMKI